MDLESPHLARSATRVARTLARGLLRTANQQSHRLLLEHDDEALHDFRVAIRRLRSLTRSLGEFFPKLVRGKLRRKLGDIARATNPSRDLEVHLAIVRHVLTKPVPARTREGFELLLQDMASQPAPLPEPQRIKLTTAFVKVQQKMLQKLREAKQDTAAPPYALTLKEKISEQAAALFAGLHELHEHIDAAHGHAVRLKAKQLRYLLEPVRQIFPDAKAAVAQLRHLQDQLGELHDWQTLELRVESLMHTYARGWVDELHSVTKPRQQKSVLALAKVRKRVREVQKRKLVHIMKDWQGSRLRRLSARLSRLDAKLQQASGTPGTKPTPGSPGTPGAAAPGTATAAAVPAVPAALAAAPGFNPVIRPADPPRPAA